ncbi:hypothetical protein Q4524_15915 [Alteromonas stellipolaris]|uniref:hypothetical protein n=1 Tax=Alteromonas stellipolaris TaxID=233316 RepID=UPI0026E24836|nr:hypothetical protein [Alteromonas stellipolaris]MDO6540069.1 hypothetical protein [Alteromonas stellipolaris]
MIEKLILVVGPESTGTRWISSVFSGHPMINGTSGEHNDTLDKFWLTNRETDFIEAVDIDKPILLSRRSIPAGRSPGEKAQFKVFQNFEDLALMCNRAGVSLHVIITTRSLYPHLNSWTRNRASVQGSLVKSVVQYQLVYRYLFEWVSKFQLPFFLISLESVLYEGKDFVETTLDFLGLEKTGIEVNGNSDVNTKHYEKLVSGQFSAISHKILKKHERSEKQLVFEFFFDEIHFSQVFNNSYNLEILFSAQESTELSVDINGVLFEKFTIPSSNDVAFIRGGLNFFNDGTIRVIVSSHFSDISKLQCRCNITAEAISRVEIDHPNSLEIKRFIESKFSVSDKTFANNILSLISQQHGFSVLYPALYLYENIDYMLSIFRLPELKVFFDKIKSEKAAVLGDILNKKVISLIEEELEKIRLRNQSFFTSYDFFSYKNQVVKIFQDFQDFTSKVILGEIAIGEIDYSYNAIVSRLVNILIVYNVPDEKLSRNATLYNDVLNSDTKMEVIDFISKEYKLDTSLVALIRSVHRGGTMSDLREYFDEIRQELNGSFESLSQKSTELMKQQLESQNSRFFAEQNKLLVINQELYKSKITIKNLESEKIKQEQDFIVDKTALETRIQELEENISKYSQEAMDCSSSLEHRFKEIAILTERCEYLSNKNTLLSDINEKCQKDNEYLRANRRLLIDMVGKRRVKANFSKLFHLLFLKVKLNKAEFSDYVTIFYSGLFDERYYFNVYDDIEKSKSFRKDPLLHYIKFGWKEFRNPSEIFSTENYIDLHSDVRSTGINPLVHFIKYGYREHRTV